MIWGTGYAGRARLVPLEQAIDLVRTHLDLSPTAIDDIFWRTPLALFGFGEAVTVGRRVLSSVVDVARFRLDRVAPPGVVEAVEFEALQVARLR